MAVPLKIRILDLGAEFCANALVFLGALQATRAIATGALQTLTDRIYHLFILVQSDCHGNTPFF
jgi:hypothetical protein